MKYFVFYEDDHPDNGGIGLFETESKLTALDFINGRITEDSKRQLNDYTLIEGRELNLMVKERIMKVEVEE